MAALLRSQQVPLPLLITLQGRRGGTALTFSHSDSGEPLDDAVLPGFANLRVRVTVRPNTAGEQCYDAALVNGNDPANTFTLRVHSMTRGDDHEATLVSSIAACDFGVCYAGSGAAARERLTVRNLSKQPLELDLHSDIPADVSFHAIATHIAEGEAGEARVPGEAAESRCTELSLLPGVVHELEMRYSPHGGALGDDDATRLRLVTFPVVLKAFNDARELVERRTIACRARVCTSLVTVTPAVIELGDLTVNLQHTAKFVVSVAVP